VNTPTLHWPLDVTGGFVPQLQKNITFYCESETFPQLKIVSRCFHLWATAKLLLWGVRERKYNFIGEHIQSLY